MAHKINIRKETHSQFQNPDGSNLLERHRQQTAHGREEIKRIYCVKMLYTMDLFVPTEVWFVVEHGRAAVQDLLCT